MLRFLLLFISILSFSKGMSQYDTLVIRPGDQLVSGELIKPYTNKWKVTFVNQDRVHIPNKVWTDYGQIIELNGEEYFHRVQDIYDPEMNLEDTWINMTKLKTLKPVSFLSIKPGGQFTYYEFDDKIISGTTNENKNEQTATINKVLPESVFDWNLYGMLLIGLPLKKGNVSKLPYYDSQTDSLNWLTSSIIDQEPVENLTGESIMTWRVETNKGLTFWLSQSAPYVIRLELQLQNNSKLLWEIF